VYVGILAKTHNVDVILDAARILASQGDTTSHFVIVGDGPGLDRIQKAACSLPNVTAPGWLDQAGIRKVMRAAYAGLLPYKGVSDAMPNKFFEYISAGLPVLSSAHGELHDLIEREQVGLPFSATQPETLVEAVATLLHQPRVAMSMAKRAAALFADRYREDLVYQAFADHVHAVARPS
jgi:glycosyltransferase involved in cell wall biosynthesis